MADTPVIKSLKYILSPVDAMIGGKQIQGNLALFSNDPIPEWHELLILDRDGIGRTSYLLASDKTLIDNLLKTQIGITFHGYAKPRRIPQFLIDYMANVNKLISYLQSHNYHLGNEADQKIEIFKNAYNSRNNFKIKITDHFSISIDVNIVVRRAYSIVAKKAEDEAMRLSGEAFEHIAGYDPDSGNSKSYINTSPIKNIALMIKTAKAYYDKLGTKFNPFKEQLIYTRVINRGYQALEKCAKDGLTSRISGIIEALETITKPRKLKLDNERITNLTEMAIRNSCILTGKRMGQMAELGHPQEFAQAETDYRMCVEEIDDLKADDNEINGLRNLAYSKYVENIKPHVESLAQKGYPDLVDKYIEFAEGYASKINQSIDPKWAKKMKRIAIINRRKRLKSRRRSK